MLAFGGRKQNEQLLENISMLIASGMSLLPAIAVMQRELPGKRIQRVIAQLQTDIAAGSALWRALDQAGIFPQHAVALIKIGEEAGRLAENLEVIVISQRKQQALQAKLRSAMLYPVFVFTIAVVLGIAITWFLLPRLTEIFDQLDLNLPWITKVFIGVGKFFGQYGAIAAPVFLISAGAALYVLFIGGRTKYLGQELWLCFPGVGRLLHETELARLGFLLGTLLQAGLPIVEALTALTHSTSVRRYQKLYASITANISDGQSFQKSFAAYRGLQRLIPPSWQALIITGEASGTLPETFLKIGQHFDEQAENTTKNLTIILEPILLVVVWLGVVTLAIAVILPIYSLIGQFNA